MAHLPIHGYSAAITALFDYLHARCTARRQEVQHALPVVRRPEIQSEHALIPRLHLFVPCQTADLCGCPMIEIADARIETANRAESRGEGNLAHWQAGFVDEFLGKVQAASLRYRYRSRSQVAQEQASKMPRSYSQSFRKCLDSAASQSTFCNQTQCSRDST